MSQIERTPNSNPSEQTPNQTTGHREKFGQIRIKSDSFGQKPHVADRADAKLSLIRPHTPDLTTGAREEL